MAPIRLGPLLALLLADFALTTKGILSPPEVSCTYNRCSLSSPCASGTCNNGYCCESTPHSKHRVERASRLNSTSKMPTFPFKADDWPVPAMTANSIGPMNGYNNGILSLDNIKLIDPQLCAGGFSSTIKCNSYGTCPPGLVCDFKTNLCCPMLMPLNGNKHHARRNYHHYHPARFNQFHSYNNYIPNNNYLQSNNNNYLSNTNGYFPRMPYMHRYPNYLNVDNDYPSISQQMRQRRPMSAYPCSNCDNQQQYYSMNPMNNMNNLNGINNMNNMNNLNGINNMNNLNNMNSIDDSGCADGENEGGNTCVGGRCGNGYSCSRNNMCCERVVPATVCPDGTQAAGGCVNGQCGYGFLCNQGLCCTNSSQTPRCLDGSQAIGACIGGKCGEQFLCTTGNICCPASLSMCPAGTSAIGPCVNGVCPVGYACINNQCCGPPAAANSTNLLTTCSQIDSNGPCLSDNSCPEPGFLCDMNNQWCCPNVVGDAVGPCIRGEGNTRLCPDGYACSGPDGGQCYKLDTGTCSPEDQFGPCNSNDPKCPAGYTCIGGFCCANGTGSPTTYKRRKRSFLML